MDFQVECCGATSYQDYSELFAISPPEECRDRRHHDRGGSYFTRGCGEKFAVWLRAWAGSAASIGLVVIVLEVPKFQLVILFR